MCHSSLCDMRHWVGARPCDGPLPFGPDAFMDEGDKAMFTHYFSSHGRCIERTDATGDCGVDVMSLMLGEERSPQKRLEIRGKLVKLVNDNRGNRALIAMLSGCQELNKNLGTEDLDSAAQELFTNRCCGDKLAEECGEIAVQCQWRCQ